MLARCMSRTISIVGAGRVGKTLGKRLRELGWRIGAVVTRSAATSRAAVRVIGAGIPHASLTSDIFDANVILIATPDDAFDAVAKALAQIGGAELRGKIILHTSGALDRRILAPLASVRGIHRFASSHANLQRPRRAETEKRDFRRGRRPPCPPRRERNCEGSGRRARSYQWRGQAHLPRNSRARRRQRVCFDGSLDPDAPAHRLHAPPRPANAPTFDPPNAR